MRFASPLLATLLISFSTLPLWSQAAPPETAVLNVLIEHSYDLEDGGRAFLLDQARNHDYFLLGELHGDNEIPKLIRQLWPDMWRDGYKHVAAEVSPWTAHQLEMPQKDDGPAIEGLWTRQQSQDLHVPNSHATQIVWGCDMEEMQPEYLIREMARLNPGNRSLAKMVELTRNGYTRSMARNLLALFKAGEFERDETVDDISLRQNLLATLEIDVDRSDARTKMDAQNRREFLMKTQLLAHIRALGETAKTKVLLRFGRNHLHRGNDARGVSTLGNFVAEYAISRGQTVFNVGAFGAGGTARLAGETFSADETKDELAFAFLAGHTSKPATVFDLRPLRPLLHAILQEKRTALETNLVYWSDSYDAIICYKSVTPLVQ